MFFFISKHKSDVLPVIPVFNFASAIGIPFVDKTVRIETLADAIVAGLEGEDVEGVQRFGEMEKISERVRWRMKNKIYFPL